MKKHGCRSWMRSSGLCVGCTVAFVLLTGTSSLAGEVEIYRHQYEREGKLLTYVKRYDPGTGKFQAGVLTPEGSLAAEPAEPRPTGKLSPQLEARLKTASQEEAVAVILYLDLPQPAHPELPDLPAFDKRKFLEEERRILDDYQQRKQQMIAQLGLSSLAPITDLYATPIVFARARPERIRALAESPLVRGIAEQELRRPQPQVPPRTPDLRVDKALTTTRMKDLHALGLIGGSTGQLAIWESGACIDWVPVTWQADPAGGTCDLHANRVATVAASFDLWSYIGDATYDTISEVEALDRTVRALRPCVTINKSEALEFQDPEENAWLNGTDHVIDATLGGRWTAQMTVAAGNNGGPRGFVLHHSFNSINVVMDEPASWRNPRSPHGDRELPQITAPTSTLLSGGSSMAAPGVAGTLTVLQEYHGAMIIPPLARAVLFAGAWRQLDPGPSWFEDVQSGVDRRKGVGLLDAYESYEILRLADGRKPGAEKGAYWSIVFDPGGGAPFTKDFEIYLPGTGTQKFRAALAWDNGTNGTRGWGGWDLYDLDLLILDNTGTIVGRSATLDNNYELAEANLPLGKTYKLRVLCRQPPAAGVVFGLAWSARAVN